MQSEKPLILVDGSSYLYRAFHAMPPLTNSKGQPTGAVYGVVNMLRRLVREHEPQFIAIVFDAKGKTFRDELYAQYKAHRPPMPDELKAQIAPLKEIIVAMGLPLLEIEGVEADDVIGTLAKAASAAGMSTLISSGDKDLAQLVSDRVTLVNTMTDTVLDRAGVEAKFGVPPERIIDYLALVGDTVDNIPGVPKVGPKTATKWLNQYGSLDDIIAGAEDIKGKVGENLRAHLDQLPLSRQLATVHCEVELAQKPQDLKPIEPQRDALIGWYKELEFRTWLSELLSGDGAEMHAAAEKIAEKPCDYQIITDEKALQRWIEKLEQAALFAFDTETNDLDYMRACLVGVSFAVEPGEAAYVPVAHDYPGAPEQLSQETVLKALGPLLSDPDKPKVGQNLKYDMSVLARCGTELKGIRFDTMLESYVLDSTATRHDMDSLALKYLGHKCIGFTDIAGKGAKQLTFNQIELEKAGIYAAEDADITLRLHQKLWPRVAAEPRLKALFEEIEMPLIPVLSRMERCGVLVDADMLRAQSKELDEKMKAIEKEAFQVAGEPFNLGSPKQIQEILFNKLKLPVLQKTPKGAPSTAESVLQELALEYPLPRLILDHRGMSKLKSTYADKLPTMMDPDTGRVHTSYHQAVAATGRLSSSDPNLQNIPVRNAEGRRIRQAFIPPPGYQMMSADYSQIELRIMAHLSGDRRLVEAFDKDEDIHAATAAEVFGTPLDQVSAQQRRHAKAINFGLIYGMSAFGLARQLGIERGAAQEYMDLYFERYPGVREYMDASRQRARDQGYVETVFGRRLYIPDINVSNHQRRQYAERTAINAPMQGTAADIIKRAMLACDRWLLESGADARMIMQVHDELVFEVAEDAVDRVGEAIRQHMAGAAQLSVPLLVEVGVGDNWDEAH